MSAPDRGTGVEPERYELQEVTLRGEGGASRREFLSVMGGGLVVVLVTHDPLAVPRLGAGRPGVRERLLGGSPGEPADGPEAIGAWLHIDEHGGITVYTGKVEIGQGIRTSLAEELAEELRVPFTAVRMGMGGNDLVPFDIGTFGSRTTPQVGTAQSEGRHRGPGIEAISNGVPVFKPPEAKNAGRTLLAMAALMGLLFVGSIGLTQVLAVTAGSQETILSALTRRVLGDGPAYFLVQISTMLILAVAANTSYAGFPRVTAMLAADGFMPRQLTNLGDRLVFANGIVALAIATGILIVVFGGDSHALIPLFAVGVFLAFTLSQTGMVFHWRRERGRRWRLKAAVNGVGALATVTALTIIAVSKFSEGAWITILLIPLSVTAFYRVRAHYHEVGEQLSLRGLPPSLKPYPPPRLVVPISGVHRGIVDAINLARSISTDVTAVYVELQPGAGQAVCERWKNWWPDVPLVVLPSRYRSIVGPLFDFLDEIDRQRNDGQSAVVVLPEFVPAKWWHGLLHNQTSWLIRTALLYRRRRFGYQRAIIDVPYHLKR